MKPKFHYRFHKNPPLVPILSQLDPAQTLTPYFFNIVFNANHPIYDKVFEVVPSLQVFTTKILYAFNMSPYHVWEKSMHLFFFVSIVQVIFYEEYNNEDLQCVIFSILLLLFPSQVW